MTVTWQWMRHGVTGGTARFPVDAAPAWTALGWEPCDEPPEDDSHLRDPVPAEEPAPAPDESTTPDSDAVGQQLPSPTARVRRGKSEEQ